jgi:tetratricopeptide (TPR) repeat protein
VRVEELDLSEQSSVLATLWDSSEQPAVAMYAPDERRVEVPDASDYFKHRGNDALRDRDYASAVTNYSHAIRAADPSNVHLYLSNRSAAYLYMSMPEKALEDANACIRANPDFAKGYSRQGNAFEQLGDLEAARKSYLTAMAHDPENSQLVAALEAMEARARVRARARARARQEEEAASRQQTQQHQQQHQQQQQEQHQEQEQQGSTNKDGCMLS